MLTVAIRAVGRVAHSGFERFAVDAFVELPSNFSMALRAGACHLPMAHRGLRIAGGENAVAAVTIGTNRGVFALQHRPAVNALQILFDGVEDRNLVSRQESGIRVALRASGGLVFLRDF